MRRPQGIKKTVCARISEKQKAKLKLKHKDNSIARILYTLVVEDVGDI